MRNKLLVVGLLLGASGCLALCGDDSKKRYVGDPEVFDSRVSSPEDIFSDFAVGDDVSVINDNATYSLDGVVVAVDPQMAVLNAGVADAGDRQRAAFEQWWARRAAYYEVRVGTGAAAKTSHYPSTNVFPVPWAGVANIKVGETFARHGVAPVKGKHKGRAPVISCTVTQLGATKRDDVMAKCEGDTAPVSVKRREMARSFTNATAEDTLDAGINRAGEIVYFNDTWAIVCSSATGTTDYILREADGANDKRVDYSFVELISKR